MKKRVFLRTLALSAALCSTFITAHAQLPTSGMQLHLDAAIGFNNGGAGAATWADQSPAANNMTATSNATEPTFVATVPATIYSGIQFNGTNQFMQNTALNATFSNKEASLFVVRVANTGDTNLTAPRTTLSISQDGVFNNEFCLISNWALHHSSTGNWEDRRHQCYNSLPSTQPVIVAAILGTAPTDIQFVVNGINSTVTPDVQSGPSNYTSINRRIYVGARMNGSGSESFFSGYILEVVAYNRKLTAAETDSVNNYLKCKYQINYTTCNQPIACATPVSNCSDTCYWKVTGNNIIGGNNIFGTLTKDNVRIQTNATDRGIFTSGGNLGWNTMAPTAFLHVNCIGGNPDNGGTASDVRFESLEKGTGNLVVIDKNGYVYNSGIKAGGGGISNACATVNIVPKVIDASGNLDCSQIYDDGTSVGIGTTTPSTFTGSGVLISGSPAPGTVATLDVNGLTFTNTLVVSSDARFKKNVQTIVDPLSIINKLNGVSYEWNKEQFRDRNFDNFKQSGFIAQDVEKVYPQAVVTDDKGYYAVNYNTFIPLLNNGVKELYAMYQEEKTKNEKMEGEIRQLQDKLDQLLGTQTKAGGTGSSVSADGSKLYQNTPNPFGNETVVAYYVAQMQQNAYIMVYDLNGKEISRSAIRAAGKGKMTINAEAMLSGMYIYSLVIDGKEIDSKRMTLIK